MSTTQAVTQSSLTCAMYEQLHSEITERLKLRQEITTFTSLLAASLFGLGLQTSVNALTALCYPILASFLSLIWAQHDRRIGQIAAYLRQMEDDLLPGYQGWERWRRLHFPVKHASIEVPAKGVFLVSDVLAMMIGLARFVAEPLTVGTTLLFIGLQLLDLVALTLTFLSLKHHRQRS